MTFKSLDVLVHSGDVWDSDDTFAVEKLLTWSNPEVRGSYWLAPESRRGDFILNLGQVVTVSNIFIVNTHNGNNRERGTKSFKISLARYWGTWMEVLTDELPDPRNLDPVPPNKFYICPMPVKYVKFELLSYWGDKGGGLQYFTVNKDI